MRTICLILCLLAGLNSLQAQTDSTYIRSDWGVFKHLDIALGLHRNPSPTESNSAYHGLEISIWNSKDIRYMHAGSGTLYFSQELGVAQKQFIHTSKAGVWLGVWGFTLGGEFKHYTNYKNQRLAFSPYFGIGNYPMRLTFGYDLMLLEEDGLNLAKGNISLSIAVFKLKGPTLKN